MNNSIQHNDCITLTFGEQAENHVGMQKIGALADRGLTEEDLREAKSKFESKGCLCELVELVYTGDSEDCKTCEKAWVLIVRNGVNCLLKSETGADSLYAEQSNLTPDSKAKMYGRVVNKHARHNLCFDRKSQTANFSEGKGTIVAWDDVPVTKRARKKLKKYFGIKGKHLKGEGNYYYDVTKCGIGFHGDSERKIVIAMRLGKTMPLHYQWYYHGNPVQEMVKLSLCHGDLYAMSEKATGWDWKRKIVPTLRHSAGANKYLVIKKN